MGFLKANRKTATKRVSLRQNAVFLFSIGNHKRIVSPYLTTLALPAKINFRHRLKIGNIIRHPLKTPFSIIAVNDVMKVTGTTYATANTLVARLTYLGSSSPACGGIRVVTHQAAAFLSNPMRRNRAHGCNNSSGRMLGRIFLQLG